MPTHRPTHPPPTLPTSLPPPSLVQEAIECDPKNPLARLEKAKVLAAMGQCEEALEQLQVQGRGGASVHERVSVSV